MEKPECTLKKKVESNNMTFFFLKKKVALLKYNSQT